MGKTKTTNQKPRIVKVQEACELLRPPVPKKTPDAKGNELLKPTPPPPKAESASGEDNR
jgi:hypothetical protein